MCEVTAETLREGASGKPVRIGLSAQAIRLALLLCLTLTAAGCAGAPIGFGEQYEIAQLKVVFMEPPQIQDKWRELSGKSAHMMTPRLAMESERRPEVIVGFYDFASQTIYCPKMNFEVCGHELHHALLGKFHLER